MVCPEMVRNTVGQEYDPTSLNISKVFAVDQALTVRVDSVQGSGIAGSRLSFTIILCHK